jgi:serine/threonine protein phosphatase PrpC
MFKTNDTVEQITVDHNPSSKGEKKRIINAGGMVRYGRIEDRLAVSRFELFAK